MRGAWIQTAALTACLLAATAPAAAQTHHWSDGDIRIVMANPSLQPQEDGAVHVGGDFIGQAFLRGNDTERVAETGFSFGTGPSSPEHTPFYTGLQDFRTDDTPEDGWILPITASDTPPGEYKFALHAYESAGDPSSEIARMWGQAVLEPEDVTPPWPWILPGETSTMSNPYGVDGVTLEFAENATASLWVNGRAVELEPWTPPERDDDNVPRQTVEEEKRVLGSGYQWTGDVTEGTTLRVEATDESGNTARKAVLAGVGADAPVVEVRADAISEELAAGQDQPIHYGVTTSVANEGTRSAEVTLDAVAPEPWTANVSPASLSLDPGAEEEIHVDAEAPAGSAATTPRLDIEVTYAADGPDVTSTFTLGAERNVTGSTGGDGGSEEAGDDENGSPSPGAVALVATLAAAGLAARARRDR